MAYKTDIKRWEDVAQQETASWGARNEVVAGFIKAGDAVMDIGAGNMNLSKLLPSACTYMPVDCVKTRVDTYVFDFNTGEKPVPFNFDVVVCSGVMEYIQDTKRFMDIIHNWGNTIILSYATTDLSPNLKQRALNGWINHLSEAQLEGLFKDAGLVIETKTRWSSQIIFKLIKEADVKEPEKEPEPPLESTRAVTYADIDIDLEKYDHTCYIVGGGPSLKDFDWTILDDKFTIALNMAHTMLPKADVIYCTDPPWISPNEKTLSEHKAPVWQGVLNLNKPPKLECVDLQWHLTGPQGFETKEGCMKHGSNSAYAATNMAAAHLGFKKIYLLGIDMKWGAKGKKDTSHWHSETKPHARIDSEAIYFKMKEGFKVAKPFLKELGVEVISVSTGPEGTDLDVFPIKTFDEVFGS